MTKRTSAANPVAKICCAASWLIWAIIEVEFSSCRQPFKTWDFRQWNCFRVELRRMQINTAREAKGSDPGIFGIVFHRRRFYGAVMRTAVHSVSAETNCPGRGLGKAEGRFGDGEVT